MGEKDKTVIQSLQEVVPRKTSRESAYFIVITGENVGRMYRLDEEVSIGRGLKSSIRVDDEGVSRHHASIVRSKDGSVLLHDEGSTNGTFVNGQKVREHILSDGDKVQIGRTTILKFSYQDNIEEAYQRQMYASATRDALTGAFNKRFFMDRLRGECSYALRQKLPLTLALLDLDHFKKVNDRYGHPAGDYILKSFAQLVIDTIRDEDVFARYGGEEFSLILRNTDLEAGVNTAERLRQSTESTRFVYEGNRIMVTVSIGVASLGGTNAGDPERLIQQVDQYLYKAKQRGRNRVAHVLN